MTIRRNLIANYLGQGWVALMVLTFIPLYIKYLGIEAYGLIGFFYILQTLLGLLDMGMTPTLSREMARFKAGFCTAGFIRDLLRTIEILALGIVSMIFIGIFISAHWIASAWLKIETLSTDVVTQIFFVIGFIIALRFIEGIYRSVLIGLQKQVLLNIIISLMATLRGLGAIGILVWISPTIQAFFFWQGVISIITLGVFFMIVHFSLLPPGAKKAQFSILALRSVWSFASGIVKITFLALLLTQIDKILLSRLLPLSEFGFYALAATASSALYLLVLPITQAFYPKFCELHARGDTATLTESFHTGAQLVSITAGSAAVILILFPETILNLWTQDQQLADRTAPLLRLLALGNLFNGLMYIPYQAQLAHGWTSLAIYINIVALVFIIPAMLWTVPHYGAEGAAWIWVVLNSSYVLIAINFMYQRILTRERWRWYWQDVFKPLAAVLVVAGTVRLIFVNQNTTITVQIGSLFLGLVLTLCAGALFSTRIYVKILDILKKPRM
jgi:O-antigen/teichoic acid export membrane protein